MGFSNYIKNNAVHEWKDFYIDYSKMRSKMKHKHFKTILTNELTKVNNFYFLLEKKAVDEKNKIFDDVFTELPYENFEDLRAQTEKPNEDAAYSEAASLPMKNQSADDFSIENEDKSSSELSTPVNSRKPKETGIKSFMKMPKGFIKRKKEKNITEFLHSLVKITAYRDINSTGILKLAKIYSELKKDADFLDEFTKSVKATYFYKSKRIEPIRTAIKQLYKRIFAKNEPEKAKTVFRRIRKGFRSSDWLFILSGILIGVSFTLAFIYKIPQNPKNFLFWAISNIYLGFLFFGFCLKIFKLYHINYKFIFNFDVCSSMNNSLYLLTVSSMQFLNVLFFVLLNKESRTIELYCVAAQAAVLIIPFDVLFYNSRFYLGSVYMRAIFQPLSTVRFRHFYFIDVATSFAFTIRQILMFGGVTNKYFIGGICSIFTVIRILQCLKRYTNSKFAFPHIINSFKFGLGLCFTISRIMELSDRNFIIFSIFFGVISSLYALIWDLFVDWIIIRNRYMFPKSVYPIIIAYNVFSRFLWINRYLFTKEFAVFESFAEILRRFLWTLLRVEVEHLNNCDELKAKNAINLTAGELFYKKDQEEVFNPTETETETESESIPQQTPVYEGESETETEVDYEADTEVEQPNNSNTINKDEFESESSNNSAPMH